MRRYRSEKELHLPSLVRWQIRRYGRVGWSCRRRTCTLSCVRFCSTSILSIPSFPPFLLNFLLSHSRHSRRSLRSDSPNADREAVQSSQFPKVHYRHPKILPADRIVCLKHSALGIGPLAIRLERGTGIGSNKWPHPASAVSQTFPFREGVVR